MNDRLDDGEGWREQHPRADGVPVLEDDVTPTTVEQRDDGPGLSLWVEGDSVFTGRPSGPYSAVVRVTLRTVAGDVTLSLDPDQADQFRSALANETRAAREAARNKNAEVLDEQGAAEGEP